MLLTFAFGTTLIKIKIENKEVTFASSALGLNSFVPIEKLIMMGNIQGILKERPDLMDLPEEEIKAEGVKMFKEKLSSMKTQEEVKNYILMEMESQGLNLIEER